METAVLLMLAAAALLLTRVARSGTVILNFGGWGAPFGVTFVADRLSAALCTVAGVVALAVAVFARADIRARRRRAGFDPLFLAMLAAVNGAFLTGDIFNLYVWFELMLVTALGLVTLDRRPAQIDGAFRYAAMSMMGATFMLVGIGLLYGEAGTLDMAHLSATLAGRAPSVTLTAAAYLLLAGVALKAGLFPLFFWLPASYHTPPAAIGAAFAGLLTKVGVYALIRVFTLLFHSTSPALFGLLLAMSAATMVIGLVAALNERDFRRVLSFNLVGHIGYTTASLSLFTPAALAGAIFYVIHHIVVITNLYLVSGVLLRLRRTTDMAGLGGLYRGQPVFALLAMVPIFSLAGVPPLSGFLGKLAILEGTFEAGAFWLGGLVLCVGLLTLLSMGRAWAEIFWQPSPEEDRGSPGRPPIAAISGLSIVTLAISVVAGPLFDITLRAAQQLLQRDLYIRAVLGSVN
jgi:multicomponent Na+:H+ antiporter subunit D